MYNAVPMYSAVPIYSAVTVQPLLLKIYIVNNVSVQYPTCRLENGNILVW